MQERPLCFTPGNRILICGSVLINFSFLILVLLFFWPGSPPLQFSSQYQSWLMGKYQCLASSYVLVHLCHVAASCCATPWISSAEPFCYCLPLSCALVGLRKLGNACDCLLCAFTWVSFWFKKKKRKKQKPKPKTQKLKLTCKHKPILLSPVGG